MASAMVSSDRNIRGRASLLLSNQIPLALQKRYIFTGYRNHNSVPLECLRSVFDVHNETLNFWTHFLSSVYFAWHLLAMIKTHDFINDIYSWPFVCFMITSCAYLLSSSIAHLFSTMSLRSHQICFFFDYASLGLYAFGVSVAYRAYAFPDTLINTLYSSIFLPSSVLVCLFCTYINCHSRLLNQHSTVSKAMKVVGFSLMYHWVSFPVTYRLFLHPKETYADSHTFHATQFMFAVITIFLYASHIPERLFPGKFDLFGNSHMLLHITGVIATESQMKALIMDMAERRAVAVPTGDVIPLMWSLGGLLFVVAANLFIIGVFVIILYKKSPRCTN